ncbi:MAG TPA: helix-hairpin-helix domain-containing protein, partial [Thermomicrobiaceae bacterium]|nr:helix-hairpin-helix domain-containing protein [Thermomicrobiaceae bacterium]
MNNYDVAEQLRQFADLLEIKGESNFRVTAYRRGAEIIGHLPEPVAELVAEGRLTDVEGIGSGLAAAVRELVETGRYSAMEEVLGEVPSTLLTLLGIPGVGPKSVGRFYREMGITNLPQLEVAARAGQLRTLKGFGPKQEARILEGIAFLNRRTNRLSIGTALPVAERIAAALAERLGARVEVVGSVRRCCETVGNVDLLAAVPDTGAIASALGDAPFVTDVELADPAFVVAALQVGATLRVVAGDPAHFGTELVRWTGNRDHVARLAELAGGDLPSMATEEEVYRSLGLSWVPPALREARGEIVAAEHHALPPLVTVGDLKGDLHLHSQWSDGRATIAQLAEAARARGYEYLSISDHSGGLAIARGL